MIFVNSLYIFDSKQIGLQFLMSFLFPFLKNITIFASFHVFGMRRSVMHFVYSFASLRKCVLTTSYICGEGRALNQNVTVIQWQKLV